ncbi:MAG: aspartyl protease family protein [Candidatus Sifarchaeia archaeon]
MKIKLGEESGHPHIPVMINGKGPFTFVLDTGASVSTLSKSLAEELGISTYEGDKKKAAGVGGKIIPIQTARLDTLEIGTLSLKDEEVGVMDFQACGTSGVIGYSTLKDYTMRLHYGSLDLTLEKRNGGDPKDSLDWISFKYLQDSHLIGVPVHINNHGPFDFILDTGSSGNVMTPLNAKEIGVPDMSSAEPIEGQGCSGGECSGVGGTVRGYAVKVGKLAIGSAELNDTLMGVIDLAVVSPDGKKIDYGIIGYPFLKNYELVIDYPEKKLALVEYN